VYTAITASTEHRWAAKSLGWFGSTQSSLTIRRPNLVGLFFQGLGTTAGCMSLHPSLPLPPATVLFYYICTYKYVPRYVPRYFTPQPLSKGHVQGPFPHRTRIRGIAHFGRVHSPQVVPWWCPEDGGVIYFSQLGFDLRDLTGDAHLKA